MSDHEQQQAYQPQHQALPSQQLSPRSIEHEHEHSQQSQPSRQKYAEGGNKLSDMLMETGLEGVREVEARNESRESIRSQGEIEVVGEELGGVVKQEGVGVVGEQVKVEESVNVEVEMSDPVSIQAKVDDPVNEEVKVDEPLGASQQGKEPLETSQPFDMVVNANGLENVQVKYQLNTIKQEQQKTKVAQEIPAIVRQIQQVTTQVVEAQKTQPAQPHNTQIPSQASTPSPPPSLTLQPKQPEQPQPLQPPTVDKYQQQLDQQMNALRNQVLKKKKSTTLVSQKQKQDKHKLNRTLMPGPTSTLPSLDLQQDTAEIRAMEQNMITKMSQEKKKQNYQRLRQWDRRRAQSLAIHRNMIETLQNEVDKRIKSSIENLEIYTTFFKEKARQEEKYISHPVINTRYALQNNNISKNVYLNCTVILNTLSDENNERCKKIADFIHLVRNDILRDSVDVHLQQSQKQLLRVREKISSLKSALRKFNSETEEKTTELSMFFSENASNMNLDSDKDFYLAQIEFLQKASQQTQVQKKLGEHCLEYLQVAVGEETKRSRVIREAMVTFSKALQQCYKIEMDPAEMEQLSKAEEDKLIEEFYSLQEIFDERALTLFKSRQHLEQETLVTVQHFSTFLNKFTFQPFDCRIALLKQFHVRYHPSSKSQTNHQQNCYLVITVDKFIHLFLSKQKTDIYAKPDISIKATLNNLEMKPGKGDMLDLVLRNEKRNSMISYFWEGKNERVYRVEFGKRDSREEFVDYVRKLKG